jgi:hypothetical protein
VENEEMNIRFKAATVINPPNIYKDNANDQAVREVIDEVLNIPKISEYLEKAHPSVTLQVGRTIDHDPISGDGDVFCVEVFRNQDGSFTTDRWSDANWQADETGFVKIFPHLMTDDEHSHFYNKLLKTYLFKKLVKFKNEPAPEIKSSVTTDGKTVVPFKEAIRGMLGTVNKAIEMMTEQQMQVLA